ncbi:hypothetical protein [Variovorax sp. M-6]|uniref:hypothetical protein n=1 Tax=Variovorax sp. M-6 TaxID=3233041 RepID=UPI003F997DB6
MLGTTKVDAAGLGTPTWAVACDVTASIAAKIKMLLFSIEGLAGNSDLAARHHKN